jgi:hypothetical protein
VTFARDQLCDEGNGEGAGINGKFAFKKVAVSLLVHLPRVNGTANHNQPIVTDASLAKYLSDVVRDRYDLGESPVSQRGHQRRFRIVDPARDYCRQPGHRGRLATEKIGPAATVAMDEIGCLAIQNPAKTPDEGQVELTGTGQRRYRDARTGCYRLDRGVAGADQEIVDPPRFKTSDQPDNLLRSAIKMTPGFDMDNFHRRIAVPGGIDLGCTKG